MGMTTRREIRLRYSLEGSGCGDCMRTACCCWCALVQQEKEIMYSMTQNTPYRPPQGYTPVASEMVYAPAQ